MLSFFNTFSSSECFSTEPYTPNTLHPRCAPRGFVASASNVSSRLLAWMIFMIDSAFCLSSDCSPVSGSQRSSCISSVLRMAESVRMFSYRCMRGSTECS